MVKIQCPNCDLKDEIKFEIEGETLEEMTIKFRCPKCNFPGDIIVIFYSNKKRKINVEYNKSDYIG